MIYYFNLYIFFFQLENMRLEKQLLETEKNDNLEKSTLIQSYKNRISVT